MQTPRRESVDILLDTPHAPSLSGSGAGQSQSDDVDEGGFEWTSMSLPDGTHIVVPYRDHAHIPSDAWDP